MTTPLATQLRASIERLTRAADGRSCPPVPTMPRPRRALRWSTGVTLDGRAMFSAKAGPAFDGPVRDGMAVFDETDGAA